MNERSLIGQEVAGYHIEDIIGKGGMAVVYLAVDPRLNRRVALKILHPVLTTDDRFRQRFILESRTVASIDHPNIIPIYEANAEGDVLYIAMRYVDGLDLRKHFLDRGPLAVAQVNRIFSQVAAALDTAHAHDLIHRDVKPANILIAGGAEGEHVYLTDFGITKHRTSISGLTQTDQFIGTPRYMAPEQINKEHIDGRCDQYAMACVVYEALAGRLPFQRDNDIALLWAHLAEAPAPLSTLRPELPLEVDGVMARALAKSPDQRFATCGEFVAALRDAISGHSAGGSYAFPVAPAGPAPHPAGPTSHPGLHAHPAGQAQPHAGHAAYAGQGEAAAQAAPVAQAAQVAQTGHPAAQAAPEAHGPQTAPTVPSAGTGGKGSKGSKGKKGGRGILIGASAAIAVIVAAAMALALVLRGGEADWKRYAPTVAAPISFEYPGEWTARTHTDLFAIASEQVDVFERLFVTPVSADWASANQVIRDDPEAATGVYAQVLATVTADSQADEVTDALSSSLPGQVSVPSEPVQVTVGGQPGVRLKGAVSDPQNGGRLDFTAYVVDHQGGTVLLIYYCAAAGCQDSVAERIAGSVEFQGS
ncbi:serine/threonine-protein kinase [Thermocatellispora tengchongensis]|uniref:non-specific serine/threonine protein kinase n=1 Tax=Thermocatellispora tengchongensis TaxID=1073253 RepID=A0A840P5S0_9ACTN|nr:serine/threonine-protein kinase [Thermocatellispora tengchongensis]